MNNLEKRISALETDSLGGVVAVHLYDGETKEEAIAAHVAGGGVDPAGAEITVLLHKPTSRPVRAMVQ
jgi:hypothetical protein